MGEQVSKGSKSGVNHFSGQFGFIISAIGSAVGLGNIWRFPGIVYENGGGAFMIPYIVALLTAGIPILFLDYAIGHRFRGSAPIAFARIKRKLECFGWFQASICFFITLYYAAIVAWAASYFIFSFNTSWGADTKNFFNNVFLATAPEPGFSLEIQPSVFVPLAIIWVAVIAVLALGITKGIEKTNTIFMPLLALSFGALVVRALFLPGAIDGLNTLFTPDFAALLDPSVWVAAYSQIFYSLSVGFGIMVTYSAYRKRKSNQTNAGLVVAFANSSFELTAGIGVFAILGFMANQQGVQISDLEGIKGVGLAFVTFPKAISAMPGAAIFGLLFFGSLLMAGFTSILSLMQVMSAALQDKFSLSAKRSAIYIGVISAVLSLILFGTTTGVYTLEVVDRFACDIGTLLLGIGTVACSLWIGKKSHELSYHLSVLSRFKVGPIWRALVTYITPTILTYICASEIWKMLTEGFGGYSFAFTATFGWSVLLLSVLTGVIMMHVNVKYTDKLVKNFTLWPKYTDELKGTKHTEIFTATSVSGRDETDKQAKGE